MRQSSLEWREGRFVRFLAVDEGELITSDVGSRRRRGRRPVVKQSEAEGQKGDDLEHGASGSTEY